MAFPPLPTERAGGAPVSTCPGLISNRVPLPGTVGARGPASRNSGLPGCVRWGLVNIPGASRGIPHISRELKAFTTAGRLGERVKEATETVLVPPSLSSQLSDFVTHCHPAGTGSLSLPPPGPHARASLQLPLPDLEKWDPMKYSSGRLTCSDAEENAGEMQSLQWTGQSPPLPTRPHPSHRGNAASPPHTPQQTHSEGKEQRPWFCLWRTCIPFPAQSPFPFEMLSFVFYISEEWMRDKKEVGKHIQLRIKAKKTSHLAIPAPVVFTGFFSCIPRTPAPADHALCLPGDPFIPPSPCFAALSHSPTMARSSRVSPPCPRAALFYTAMWCCLLLVSPQMLQHLHQPHPHLTTVPLHRGNRSLGREHPQADTSLGPQPATHPSAQLPGCW